MESRIVLPVNQGWTFQQADDDSRGFLPVARFPTTIHLDLIHHNIIPDPFVGKNEAEVQWVGEKAWVYKTTFAAPAVRDGSRAVLVFHGLDTHATVVVNGEVRLKAENMFVPERVDITDLVRAQGNEVQITFDSTWFIGKKIVEKYPEHRWGCWNGDPSRLAVRKAQYHYVRVRALAGHRD
jgi:beta-mannosidase